jgi:hypothetical protein
MEVGRKADDLALQQNYCCEIQRKEKCMNLSAAYKERYGSKTAVLPNDDGDGDDQTQDRIKLVN